MTERTFTHADLEQMAAATIASSPFPEAQQKAYAPAVRVLLAALADGRPATTGEMAAAAGLTADEVTAILLAVGGVERDAEGRVTGFGITLNPTPHRVETGSHVVYGWCAADTLWMPPVTGREATITSPCPATGQTVTVTAGPDGVQDVHPAEAVVSAILTGDWDDIRGTVCNLGNFYASADAAAGWAAEHPDGVLLTVPDASHYARSCMRPILDG
jgi:alkylmercury lyase